MSSLGFSAFFNTLTYDDLPQPFAPYTTFSPLVNSSGFVGFNAATPCMLDMLFKMILLSSDVTSSKSSGNFVSET